MDDETIISRIRALVEEEEALHGPDNPLSDSDARRRTEIEAELDQCYDLLRQRRAQREHGRDPDEAAPRPPQQIETYVGEDQGPPR